VIGDRPKPVPLEALGEPGPKRVFDGLAEAA